MKLKNPVTILTGIILVIIFVLMVFTYQVRLTEVAVVTTFDSPKGYVTEPGLHFKWPSPIQKVYKFDNRTHNFEDKFETAPTFDNQPLLVMLYIGWKISDPKQYFSSFSSGRAEDAEGALESLARAYKLAVIGKHPFNHLVSTDPKSIQFAQIEKEILDLISADAKTKFGVEVKFVGIKRLGLPEAVTRSAMDRMQKERETQVARIRGEGEKTGSEIRSNADTESARLLAGANQRAEEIKAQADAKFTELLEVVSKEPDLYRAQQLSRALPEVLRGESTLIVDRNTWPYSMLTSPELTGSATNARAR